MPSDRKAPNDAPVPLAASDTQRSPNDSVDGGRAGDKPSKAEQQGAPFEENADLEGLADEARALRESANELTVGAPAGAGRPVVGPRRRRSKAPAEGERNAIVGYLGQYEFAASRTLAVLREGTLVAVRVADVSAGQIDDFQVQSTDRVDAHQVKWSLHAGNVGYAEFVRDTADRTRYVRQLADGWERLTAIHGPQRVVVHFVTNDVPSSGTSPSIPRPDNIEQPVGGTWSFAALLTEAWQPAIDAVRAGANPDRVVPARWAPAMAALADASGLDAAAWLRFLADCELDFGAPSLDATIAAAPVSDSERAVLRQDAERLAHAYMRLVARPDRRVEFSREQLLDELGWRFRAEFKNRHEFPDPEIPYRSIASTAHELTEAVARLTGGYVAVIGSPGSGKSTLVTRTLRESADRVVRYYAYVRDAVGGSLRRGEAVNFFHDLTVALDRAGLHTGATLPVADLDLLTRRVHAQLGKAHTEWAAGGRRTIILVDGLDHIPREQRPMQSLLDHLPHPEDIPDGVLFVLGTQTDRLQGISPRIREQLDEPGRRIAMQLLERGDVLAIIEATTDLAPEPTSEERERIFELSGGHPLALNYIINRLRHAQATTVADTLDAVEPFNEGIDRQYVTIWGIVEDDVELARLLAVLARTRGPTRLEWLRQWAPRQALHTVTTRLAYLFRQEFGARWTFFHNSFRAFIIERTREVPALGGEADLFAELAERCTEVDPREPERADELYFRARAGDVARVLALAEPANFRNQFVAGRRATTIRDDIALALDAAVTEHDIIGLTRILLCSAEFGQREYYAENLPIAETWLELGDMDRALAALREGASLRSSRQAALRAAAVIDAGGLPAEAREVFTLAEPLDVLRGTARRTGRPDEQMELLDAWIEVAPRFRPVSVIREMIQHMRVSAEDAWPSEQEDRANAANAATKDRQYRLRNHLAAALDRLARWEEADAIRAELRSQNDAAGWWFWAQTAAWYDAFTRGEAARAEARFAELQHAFEKSEIPKSVLTPAARTALAAGYLRLPRDAEAARRVLDGVEQPAPVTDYTYGHGDGWAPFHQRFALNRVLGALGDRRPLHDVVPDSPLTPTASRNRRAEAAALVTKFERAVVQLGRLAGQAWVGAVLAPSNFEVHARALVRLFPRHPQLMQGAYIATQARKGFYTRLAQVAASHGQECIAVLQRVLDTEWTDETRRDAWPDSLMRTILSEMLLVGASNDWVRAWLARLEPATFRGEDMESELSDGVAHARAWVAAGDVVAARTTLEHVLDATFGVEAKDDQLNSCLIWAVRANREDPDRTPQRLTQMATAVSSLDGSEAQGYIAPKLLEAGVASGARPARALVEWALRSDVSTWVDALTILVDGLATQAPSAAATLSACYRSLVLPFARSAETGAVGHLAISLRATGDAQELDGLANAIDVVALGSTRPALREAIAGRPEDATELLRDDSVSDPTAPNQVVDAFAGLSLTLKELRARVQSVEDVEDLARRLKPDAFSYRWELILEPFLGRATADQLVAAAAAIPANNYAWAVLATIAEQLLELCDPRAEAVIERVVGSSRAAGWWPGYDGGSRLRGYELLVRLAPEVGRRAAWEALRRDIAAGEVRPLDVFRGWERVVAMLAPETPAVSIWDVVSRHVAALVACAPQGEPPAIPPAEDPTDPHGAASVVSGLVAPYLDHPAYGLARGAQQFFADRLLAQDSAAEDTLSARLADADAPKEGALLVLRAIAQTGGNAPTSMQEALRVLQRAPSFPDRRSATLLLGSDHATSIGDADTAVVIARPLPAVFNLVHPPAQPRRRRPLPGRGEMLAPVEYAADLVSVFEAELNLIAKWADVQSEALYHYVADRATGYLPADSQTHSFDDEPALRDEMRRLGLEITYRRPRPRRVERAMAEAVAMLVDHGRLGPRYFPALDRLFLNADPYFVIARPTRRPSFVATIPERADSKYVDGDWTAEVNTTDAIAGRTISEASTTDAIGHAGVAPDMAQTEVEAESTGVDASKESASDAWVVLAEETWLRWLDWKYATETRVGARLEPTAWGVIGSEENSEETPDRYDIDGDAAAGKALAAHMAELSHLTVDEYLIRGRAAKSIVVRNLAYRFATPADRWLAFNPALAEFLGWRPDATGLFRWLDADGRIVAESVWWQDGFAQQHPPQFDDEVGHGWLVRASRRGWDQISAAVGDCVDWRRVARLALEQQPQAVVEWDPVS